MATALLVSVPAPAAHAGLYKLNYIYIKKKGDIEAFETADQVFYPLPVVTCGC